MTTPPRDTLRARPRSLAPRELGFRRRHPVAWLSPMLLAGTAVRLAGAYFFGAYLDKRELQGVLPTERYDHSADTDADGEFWLDYTADLGDGFDATYSVAWVLSQPSLQIDGQALPRGQVLVMGGDQVYPTAGYVEYEDRFQGPYRAAMPTAPDDDSAPSLYALPGNHDWYDGLTAFLRMFGRRRPIGGRQTRQTRSYFALKLPNRWWLFAVDGQLTSYIDEPQLAYFQQIAQDIAPDDRVLLCVSEPDWIRTPGNPDAYTTIDYFRRTVIDPTGASCELVLAGDKHHYARYEWERGDQPPGSGGSRAERPAERATEPGSESALGTDGVRVDDLGGGVVTRSDTDPADQESALPDPTTSVGPASVSDVSDQPANGSPRSRTAPGHLITCGGGGAYLSDTAHLPATVQAPADQSLDPQRGPAQHYRLATRYPSEQRSRSYGWGIFGAIMRRNPGFSTFVGLIHVLVLMAYLAASDPLFGWISVGVSALVVVGTTVLAGKPKGNTPTTLAIHRVLGVAHGLAHLGLAAVGAIVWSALPFDTLPWVLPGLTAFLVYGPVAAFLGAELVALYLFVAGQFGVNLNELFAGQGIENSKAFLRIRISRDGSLTIYPVGLDRVCHKWQASPDDPPETPWIAPRTPLTPHLIERPVRLPAVDHEGVRQPSAEVADQPT